MYDHSIQKTVKIIVLPQVLLKLCAILFELILLWYMKAIKDRITNENACFLVNAYTCSNLRSFVLDHFELNA